MRQARSSEWAGKSSITSPRTRKLPRSSVALVRRYCRSISLRMRARWSTRPSSASETAIEEYVSTAPMP